jgi:hypothetical protein
MAKRVLLVIAKAMSLPALICAIAGGSAENPIGT